MESLTAQEHKAIDQLYEESLSWVENAAAEWVVSKLSKRREKKLLELLGAKRFRKFKAEVKCC